MFGFSDYEQVQFLRGEELLTCVLFYIVDGTGVSGGYFKGSLQVAAFGYILGAGVLFYDIPSGDILGEGAGSVILVGYWEALGLRYGVILVAGLS